MSGQSIGGGVHAGEDRAAGGRQRLLGLQNNGDLDEVEAAGPDEGTRAFGLGDFDGLGVGVAKLAQAELLVIDEAHHSNATVVERCLWALSNLCAAGGEEQCELPAAAEHHDEPGCAPRSLRSFKRGPAPSI